MADYVGSKWVRGAGGGFALLCIAAIVIARQSEAGSSLRWILTTLGFVLGVATLACLPLCSRRFYPIWMRWAERLNTVVLTLLFGLCYLLIVPLFFLLQLRHDPLGLRRDSGATTFWVTRAKGDAKSFDRMG